MKTVVQSLLAAGALSFAACASSPGANISAECKYPTDNLLSDFEDGSNGIAKSAGRSGGWYVYNDGSKDSVQDPPAGGSVSAKGPGACNSDHSLTTSGHGFTDWGAGIGTDLTSTKTPYDLSKYQGLRFWAKSDPPLPVRVKIPDVQSTPPAQGGTCQDSPTSQCNDNFGTEVTLTADWARYEVTWESLKQEGWGQKFNALQKTQALAVQMQMGKAVAAGNFQIWVDQIGFY